MSAGPPPPSGDAEHPAAAERLGMLYGELHRLARRELSPRGSNITVADRLTDANELQQISDALDVDPALAEVVDLKFFPALRSPRSPRCAAYRSGRFNGTGRRRLYEYRTIGKSPQDVSLGT